MNLKSLIALLILSSSAVAVDYKGVVTPVKQPVDQDQSLEGWDGSFTICADGSNPPCWNNLVAPFKETRIYRPFVSLGGGFVKTDDIGASASFPVETTGGDFFTYNPSNPKQTGGIANIFLGVEWRLDPAWRLQGGLNFDQVISEYNAHGVLTQGQTPDTEQQFNYHYNLTTRQFLAAGKLLYTIHSLYHPYAFLGLGIAYNDAYDFTTNVPSPQTFTRVYNNNTNTSFVFNVGLGIDINLGETFRLGIGYRYTDLGEAKLGKAFIDNTEVSGTLSQTHLYTNVFLAELTFLI